MTPENTARVLSAQRWARIEDVFHQARRERGAARMDALRRLCAEDSDLLAQVQSLLEADDIVNRPRPATEKRAADLAGRRAGNYQLDSLLGTGGMGSVYLAHRCDGQFDRQVALKVLGANLRDEFFTERFEVERRLLAALDHPNITRLLDSGVSETGDPYLVLEYVNGRPISRYCDERRLTVEDRVRLFLQVCAAVEYAHSRHVIHRDLKPSNILVTGISEERYGTVKLLDFGTAKLLEAAEPVTATRFRMMTPQYASPEQLRGDPLTAACDVYSLGIVLYELLTGGWPYGDPQSVISGLERAVRDVEPRHPWMLIDAEAAARRSISATALVRLLKGDLCKVIFKAIQAEPDGRYRSAQELSRDLERYLQGSPVLARPQTLSYRGGKWIRRHRRFAALGLAAAALAGGLYVDRVRSRPPASGQASLVVLPFESLGGNPANQYFSEGLTAAIAEGISHLKPLRVIGSASALQLASQFKGKAVDPREAGRQLQVTNVLQGSVWRDENRVKVIARLERASDGSQLWSHTYERPTSDLSSIQPAVAADVASSLNASPRIPGPAKHVVRDHEAIDAYMRAVYEADKFTLDSMNKAVADLQYAVQRDPLYAEAYAFLGVVMLNRNNVAPVDDPNINEIVAQNYRKALDLDPDLVSPRVNLARFALELGWDWEGAEREFQTALAKGPSAGANMSYGWLLLFEGRVAEADERFRMARELDPLATVTLRLIAQARILEGRYDETVELAQELLLRAPNDLFAKTILLDVAHTLQGRADLALQDYRRLEPKYPQVKSYEAETLACAGRRQEALALIRPFEERHPHGEMPNLTFTGIYDWGSFAGVYACMGDEAQTVKWLQKAADNRDAVVLTLGVNPIFAKVRNAPGVQAVMKRVGLKH